MIARTTRRTGFTLLEVLLASTIAVLLLAALYASFDVVIAQSDIGREEVEKNDLARAVVTRITIDLVGTVGPLPPKSGGVTQAATAAAAATGQTDPTTDPMTGGTTDPTMAETETETTDPTVTVASTGGDIPFGAGLVGNGSTMTLFVSRVPLALVNAEAAAVGTQQPADLRRITYYRSTSGLCRQERPWVTSDGVWNSADADRTDELGDLLAEEITDVQFQYFDGSSWVDSWDGTQMATDGKTLLGPPRGVKITLVIERPNTPSRRLSHVFALRAANGLTVVEPPAEDTTGGTTP